MDQKFNRKRLSKSFRMRVKAFGRFLFACLIVALVPFVLWHQMQREELLQFRGLVEAEAETVGPVETARIVAIDVVPGQRVKPGDVLVRFDAADRALADVLNRAKLNDYEQSAVRFEQTRTAYIQGLKDSERKYRQLSCEASVALEEQKMNQVRDRAELDGLKAEIERLSPMVKKGLVSELELSSLRPKAEALERTVTQYTPLIESLQKRLDQTNADLNEVHEQLEAANREQQLAKQAEAKAAKDAELYQAEVKKGDPMVLKALSAGVVSQVFRRVGDVVPAGDPVVRITSDIDSLFVTGMLPLDRLDQVHVGDVFRAVRAGRIGDTAQILVKVETIAPEVMDVFDPMNPAPRVPVRGRKIRMRIENASMELVPGETVLLTAIESESCWEGVKRICGFGVKSAKNEGGS